MKQKLLVKILDEDEWKWVHLCYIDSKVYHKFRELPGYKDFTIGSHISRWMLADLHVKLSMVHKNHLRTVKAVIKSWYRRAYPELYIKQCPGNKQRIANLVGIWITQHMKYEIENMKGEEPHE